MSNILVFCALLTFTYCQTRSLSQQINVQIILFIKYSLPTKVSASSFCAKLIEGSCNLSCNAQLVN